MRCCKCGQELPGGTKFCNLCGAPLTLETKAQEPKPAEPVTESTASEEISPPPKKANKRIKYIGIAGGMAAIILIISLVIGMNYDSDIKKRPVYGNTGFKWLTEKQEEALPEDERDAYFDAVIQQRTTEDYHKAFEGVSPQQSPGIGTGEVKNLSKYVDVKTEMIYSNQGQLLAKSEISALAGIEYTPDTKDLCSTFMSYAPETDEFTVAVLDTYNTNLQQWIIPATDAFSVELDNPNPDLGVTVAWYFYHFDPATELVDLVAETLWVPKTRTSYFYGYELYMVSVSGHAIDEPTHYMSDYYEVYGEQYMGGNFGPWSEQARAMSESSTVEEAATPNPAPAGPQSEAAEPEPAASAPTPLPPYARDMTNDERIDEMGRAKNKYKSLLSLEEGDVTGIASSQDVFGYGNDVLSYTYMGHPSLGSNTFNYAGENGTSMEVRTSPDGVVMAVTLPPDTTPFVEIPISNEDIFWLENRNGDTLLYMFSARGEDTELVVSAIFTHYIKADGSKSYDLIMFPNGDPGNVYDYLTPVQ